MAETTSEIKKAIVPKASLPPLNGINQSYYVRYRIITEDKNRTSHWSQRYTLIPSPPEQIPLSQTSISIAGTGTTRAVTLVWTPPSTLNSQYFDIYVKIGSGQYEYKTTVSTNTYAMTASLNSQVSIVVQIPTYPKTIFTSATLFERTITVI